MACQESAIVVDGDAGSARIAAFQRDRRELVRRGLAFGGAVVAASSIPLLASVRNAFAAGEDDSSILAEAIRLERIAVLVYDRAIESGLLSTRVERVAKLFSDNEREHAGALTAALADLGAQPPAQPTVKDIDSVVGGIGDVSSQADVLRFAIEFEMAVVAAYHDAQQKLSDAELLQLGASIMANQGQHLVVLRQTLKQPPVPNAFETGEN